ncbi:hypothetical protein [Comamonas piscis]
MRTHHAIEHGTVVAGAVVGIKGAGAIGTDDHAGDADGSVGRGGQRTNAGQGQQGFCERRSTESASVVGAVRRGRLRPGP